MKNTKTFFLVKMSIKLDSDQKQWDANGIIKGNPQWNHPRTFYLPFIVKTSKMPVRL